MIGGAAVSHDILEFSARVLAKSVVRLLEPVNTGHSTSSSVRVVRLSDAIAQFSTDSVRNLRVDVNPLGGNGHQFFTRLTNLGSVEFHSRLPGSDPGFF